jgi:hypothetical protein
VDFIFDGRELRGLEQNPNTKSRWAQMAGEGAKVMQFLDRGKYVAAVTDGKVRLYPRRPARFNGVGVIFVSNTASRVAQE